MNTNKLIAELEYANNYNKNNPNLPKTDYKTLPLAIKINNKIYKIDNWDIDNNNLILTPKYNLIIKEKGDDN